MWADLDNVPGALTQVGPAGSGEVGMQEGVEGGACQLAAPPLQVCHALAMRQVSG